MRDWDPDAAATRVDSGSDLELPRPGWDWFFDAVCALPWPSWLSAQGRAQRLLKYMATLS